MKRKFLQFKKIYLTALTLIVLGNGSLLAQTQAKEHNEHNQGGEGSNYKIHGNSNLDDSSTFIGSTNAKDFVIRTNNQERFRLDKYGNSIFKNYLKIVYG